jgi:hypothetical protein
MGVVAVSHRIRYKTRDSGILLNIAKIRAGVWSRRRRAQDVHGPLGLHRNGLPADLVRHHALRRDRRGLHLPDSRRAA